MWSTLTHIEKIKCHRAKCWTTTKKWLLNLQKNKHTRVTEGWSTPEERRYSRSVSWKYNEPILYINESMKIKSLYSRTL